MWIPQENQTVHNGKHSLFKEGKKRFKLTVKYDIMTIITALTQLRHQLLNLESSSKWKSGKDLPSKGFPYSKGKTKVHRLDKYLIR